MHKFVEKLQINLNFISFLTTFPLLFVKFQHMFPDEKMNAKYNDFFNFHPFSKLVKQLNTCGKFEI